MPQAGRGESTTASGPPGSVRVNVEPSPKTESRSSPRIPGPVSWTAIVMSAASLSALPSAWGVTDRRVTASRDQRPDTEAFVESTPGAFLDELFDVYVDAADLGVRPLRRVEQTGVGYSESCLVSQHAREIDVA